MKFLSLVLTLLAMIATSVVSCAHRTEHKEKTVTAIERDNDETVLYDRVVINFNKGSSNLTADEKARLQSAVRTAQSRGDIEKIDVAAWSDRIHSTSDDLPRADRRLAEERISSIKEAMNPALGTFDFVTEYNMAKRSSWWDRAFNTREAELDSSYSKRTDVEHKDLSLIRDAGAPGKAIVVLVVESDND